MTRPFLARDRVRFVGEPVAVDRHRAARAGRRRRRAGVGRLRAAARGGRPARRPDRRGAAVPRGRRHQHRRSTSPSVAPTTSSTAARWWSRQDVVNQRVAAVPARGARGGGRRGSTGGSCSWSSTQNAHGARDALAGVYGLDAGAGAGDRPRRRRRVRRQDRRLPRGAAARLAGPPGRPAGALGRDPQREHGRPRPRAGPASRRSRSAAGATAPSRPTGSPCCRTPAPTPSIGAILPFLTRMMAQGIYDIPKVEFNSTVGHHQHHADRRLPRRRAARGDRRHRAGHGPLRGRDRHGPGRGAAQEPHRRATRSRSPAPTGTTYDIGDYERALDLALEAAGYDGAARRAGPAARGRRGACSSASACRSTSRSPPGRTAGKEYAKVEVQRRRLGHRLHRHARRTGRATTPRSPCSPATSSASRWSASTWCTATPTSSTGGEGTMGSRSLQLGGSAVHQASVGAGRARRGRSPPTLLEANPDDVVLDKAERALPRGRHARRSAARWAELSRPTPATATASSVVTDFQAPAPTFPFGAHVAVVDVDTETGEVALVRLIAVDDAGRILNPLLADGPAPRRHRPGRRPGAARGGALRRGRQPDHVEPRRLRRHLGHRAAQLRAGGDGDAHPRQPARRQGHRRVGHDRLHARRCRPRWSTRSSTSACATSTCPHPRAGVAGDLGQAAAAAGELTLRSPPGGAAPGEAGSAKPERSSEERAPELKSSTVSIQVRYRLCRGMADKITANADGTLNVPDEPIIPFIEGDGTGVDIWPAAKLVLDAAAAKHGRTIEWMEVLAGEKAFNETGDWLPAGHRRHVPGVPHRHQGPAHHADRRRLPLPQRGAAPDPRPLRVPAPGALVHGRAVAGEAPRDGRHGDLPGEHRGHLRRPRGRGGHAEAKKLRRAAARRLRLGHPRGLRHRHQADLRDRLEAPDPGRLNYAMAQGPQERHPRAQGQHHEVHRGRLPQLGLRARAGGVLRRGRRLGRLRRRARATRSWSRTPSPTSPCSRCSPGPTSST